MLVALVPSSTARADDHPKLGVPLAQITPSSSGEESADRTAGSTTRLTLAERFEALKDLRVDEAFDQISQVWPQIALALAGVVVVFLIAAGVMRPGGFKKDALRDVKPYPAVIWAFAGLIVMLSLPLATDSIERMGWFQDQFAPSGEQGGAGSSHLADAVAQGSGYLIASIIALVMVYMMSKSAPKAGLRFGGMDLMIGLGCFLLTVPLIEAASIGSQAVFVQMTGREPAQLAHTTLQMLVENRGAGFTWIIMVSVVIGAPIVEEIVFRVGLQSALLRMFGSPWAACLLTSGVFAAMHWSMLPADGWHALGPLFVLSISLGIAFERTKRIGVPIAMHMAFNAMNIAVAMAATAT